MEKLSIKQQLDLEILVKKTKSKHLILSTLENAKKEYFINKKITLPFFKTLAYDNTKFPLYLHTIQKKAESGKKKKKKKANIVILDNFLIKKATATKLFIAEERVISLLKETSGNTKRGN